MYNRPIAMFCPLCRAEYSPGHTHCTVCGVGLVPEEQRGQPLDEKQKSDSLAVVWKGGDPVAVSQVIAELRRAGIRHHVKPTEDHLVFELGIPRPRYEVRVFSSDAPAAFELLLPIREAPAFALVEPGEDSPDGETPAAPALAKRRSLLHWKPQKATVEIWSADDPAVADILTSCLAENRIGVRREGAAPGTLRLFVRPEDAEAAREILREVIEASPPA